MEIPGPWEATAIEPGHEFRTMRRSWAITSKGGRIGCVYADDEATARLMAAAPELLAACKALVELVREGGDCFVPEIVQGEVAIAKAEGQS